MPPNNNELIVKMLQNLWIYFNKKEEMQNLIIWENSAPNNMMKSIHNTREANGERIFELTRKHFKK
jgi:hypothetical protein